MLHHDALTEAKRRAPALEALCVALHADLERACGEAKLDVQFVSSRVKSHASLTRKLARPDKTYSALWDVTDLVGLRVAVYFEDAVERVARLIEKRYAVDYSHSTDKLRSLDAERFGYRSLHYTCRPSASVLKGLPARALPRAFRFEIQVRTSLQHAWAEVEHDLGYKADTSVPDVVRRRFSRVASLLEIADQEFVALRQELSSYERSAQAVDVSDRPLPIDVVSVGALAGHAEVRARDAQVARMLGKRVADNEVFFPDYLARMLSLAGLSTTREVHAALATHGARVAPLVTPYFAYAGRALGLDRAALSSVPRGYSLFFLAHAVLLHGPELGIDKVARLARVYQELDHPDDPARAHTMAAGLVAALGAHRAPQPRGRTPRKTSSARA